MHPLKNRVLVPLTLLAVATTPLAAQCSTVWSSSSKLPGANSIIYASVQWDVDGPGPSTPQTVLAGRFNAAGDIVTNGIACWDPATGAWSAFGSGLSGQPDAYALAVATLPNGCLVAAGSFTMAGGVPANRIACWNGTAWSPLGSGLDGRVFAMIVLANGDLVVGGEFTTAGGVAANRIARWDGTAWSALGSGCDDRVRALVQTPDCSIIAAGEFLTAGGVAANRIARWDGTTWCPLGTGIDGPFLTWVERLTCNSSGCVVAGGRFATAGGASTPNVALWNGTTWSAIGDASYSPVTEVQYLQDGHLVLGTGSLESPVKCWDGSTWQQLGDGFGNSWAHVIRLLPDGRLLVGGQFSFAGGQQAANLAFWDGAAWSALPGGGFDGPIAAMATLPGGDIVVGGAFVHAPGILANGVARWNGSAWSAVGTGIEGNVNAVTALPNGDVIVAGGMISAGGSPVSNIARWNGTTWSPLGTGVNGWVWDLVTMPNGDVIAGGEFTTAGGVAASYIARWSGASWSAMGNTGTQGPVRALAVRANGELIASFKRDTSYSVVSRWTGTSWSMLGAPPNNTFTSLTISNSVVDVLAALPNGDIVAGGTFDIAGPASAANIARWNDTTGWSPLGSGITGSPRSVFSLMVLPAGDLLVGGYFSAVGGVPAQNLARWNGSTWSSLGNSNGTVAAIRMAREGNVLFGGGFTSVGTIAAPYLACLSSTCPASTVHSGDACAGAGSTNCLAATTLPWVNSTFRATGSGLPTNSLVITMTSLTPIPQGQLPLSSIFSQAGPDCDALVQPDMLGLLVTTTGTAQSSLFLPNVPPLVGMTFFHQMVPIAVGPGGVWTEVTATNALQLTAGVF